MNLTMSSFVSQSSLLTVKGVNLVVAHDGFFHNGNRPYFVVATLIAEVLFEQFLIRNTCNRLNIADIMGTPLFRR